MTPRERTRIVQQVMDRFQVGPIYATNYLTYLFKGEDLAGLDLDNHQLPPLTQIYLEFALSTNLRGEAFYHDLSAFLPKTGKRYLDVGCGYGGFLVAFSNHGYEVAGMDISQGLVDFSKDNLADHGVSGPVLVADILHDDLKSTLGTFDVITCYDVLEHVDDMARSLDRMLDLLNPGGLLGIKVPNKDSMNFVAKDGHYNLFGITQLPHDLARQYHQSLDGNEYSVGEFYPLETYITELEKRGCTVHSPNFDEPLRFRRMPGRLRNILREYGKYRREVMPKLPRGVSSTLNRNLLRYFARLLWHFFIPRGLSTHVPRFRKQYLVDAWTILAIKNP